MLIQHGLHWKVFNKPVVLILGGVDKGNDYEMLEELIKEKVKAIVCLGKDNKKIFKAFSGMVEGIVETDSAESAVRESYRLSKKVMLFFFLPLAQVSTCSRITKTADASLRKLSSRFNGFSSFVFRKDEKRNNKHPPQINQKHASNLA